MVDASLRANILEALVSLRENHKVNILYITHDLTTAYHVSDSIIVLYRGSVMEAGDITSGGVPTTPLHSAADQFDSLARLRAQVGQPAVRQS